MTTNWRSYFDIVIVSAKKPLFFESGKYLSIKLELMIKGTVLRKVDTETGRSFIGTYAGPLNQGDVYEGGEIPNLCESYL